MKRRDFLQTAFLSYLALNFRLTWAESKIKKEIIYATKSGEKYFINLFHDSSNQHIKIEIPFRVHSVRDLGSRRVLLIEKKGTGCCIVDFNLQKIERQLQEPKDQFFYGHAEIDFKSQQIYFPQRYNNENHIFKRSLRTLEKSSDSIYKTTKEIHMISFVEDDRLAICIDDKVTPSIDILNIENKYVRSIPIENRYFRPGHLCPVKSGEIYVTGIVGDDYDGAAVLHYLDKEIAYLPKDIIQKMKPVFWMARHPVTGNICGVSPDSNRVVFISKNRKILKVIDLAEPYGVDINDENFVVIGPKGLSYFDSKSLNKVATKSYPDMKGILEDFHPIIL